MELSRSKSSTAPWGFLLDPWSGPWCFSMTQILIGCFCWRPMKVHVAFFVPFPLFRPTPSWVLFFCRRSRKFRFVSSFFDRAGSESRRRYENLLMHGAQHLDFMTGSLLRWGPRDGNPKRLDSFKWLQFGGFFNHGILESLNRGVWSKGRGRKPQATLGLSATHPLGIP